MARLLFLGASISQLPAIRYAKSRGHTVIACDGDPNAAAFPLCDVAAVLSFSDVEAVVDLATRQQVEGVLAVCTDRAVSPAASIAQQLHLPGLTPEVARSMSHKPTMRARLEAARIPQPAFAVLDDAPGRTVAPWSRFPAVVKPADSGGQRGLSLIRGPEQVEAARQEARIVSRSGEVMLEQYIEGLELNLLFAMRDGEPTLLVASDRLRPSGAGFGVGWIHSFPSSLAPSQLTAVEQTAAAAVRALGMQNGIAFPQMIWGDDGPVVVEVAARIAAGQMADLVRHATGIEVYEIAVQQALGRRVPDSLVTASRTRPVAIRFLTASPGVLPVGEVTSIHGLDEMRAAPGILDAGVYFQPGETIAPLRVDADRRGYVIATAESAEAALQLADRAARLLRIATSQPASTVPPSERPSRVGRPTLAAAVLAVLMVASVGAVVVSEHAKLQRALVAGTHVDKTFSPTCRCAQRIAHVTFRVLRRSAVDVGIVDTHGRLVRLLEHLNLPGRRVVRAAWDGRTSAGRLIPSGVYYPFVYLAAVRRRLVLPSPITVDTDRPRIIGATAATLSDRVVVHFRLSEHAHVVLLLGGRRVVFTRFEPLVGTLEYRYRLDGQRKRHPHRVELMALDPAGNRSLPRFLALRHP